MDLVLIADHLIRKYGQSSVTWTADGTSFWFTDDDDHHFISRTIIGPSSRFLDKYIGENFENNLKALWMSIEHGLSTLHSRYPKLSYVWDRLNCFLCYDHVRTNLGATVIDDMIVIWTENSTSHVLTSDAIVAFFVMYLPLYVDEIRAIEELTHWRSFANVVVSMLPEADRSPIPVDEEDWLPWIRSHRDKLKM